MRNRFGISQLPFKTIPATAVFLAGLSLLVPPISAVAEIQFDVLGDPRDSSLSMPKDVSADGSIVVGYTSRKVFRWENGKLEILDVPGQSRPGGISDDGSVIVAYNRSKIYFVRNGETEMIRKGPGYNTHPHVVSAISPDGSKFVGYTEQGHAFIWSSGTLEEITSRKGFKFPIVEAISADGNVLVGAVGDPRGKGKIQAWMWKDGEILGLPLLPETSRNRAYAVNRDGTVIVGRAYNHYYDPVYFYHVGIRWDAEGMIALGSMDEEYPFSTAYAVSRDGSVVAGSKWEWYNRYARAVVWSAANKWQPIDLNGFLDENGIDRKGFVLEAITDISADGKTFIGYGRIGMGLRDAFRVRFVLD